MLCWRCRTRLIKRKEAAKWGAEYTTVNTINSRGVPVEDVSLNSRAQRVAAAAASHSQERGSLHSNPVKRDPVSSSVTKNDVEFADKKQRVQLAFTGKETALESVGHRSVYGLTSQEAWKRVGEGSDNSDDNDLEDTSRLAWRAEDEKEDASKFLELWYR
ncbi:hypothetical protein WH47_09305 [Habropoda laboriosa]|uniref:Uncharacterized protein n=1 Tax=Habropoda laboriosa TaxID=597456 RepID=A0A0L7R972_9HYME|nr:hypothetical protein WH47_09305 [Habropoda laboriosa]